MKKILQKAENNMYKCTCCRGKIIKGELYFRDAQSRWRSSHTVNICRGCIIKMAVEVKVTDKELSSVEKEAIVDSLESENEDISCIECGDIMSKNEIDSGCETCFHCQNH